MKIKQIELKNFKFHHDLTIDIKNQTSNNESTFNTLIYGENGTGKSSIFEALYANFYESRRVKSIDIYEMFKNRNHLGEELEVNISFDGSFETITRSDNTLSYLQSSSVTAYCTNERILTRITKDNFYETIKHTLTEHFIALKDLYIFDDFKIRLRDSVQFTQELRNERDALDERFNTLFNDLVPRNKINDVLGKLDANFKIAFDIQHSENTTTFTEPNIAIFIEDESTEGKLYNHFNEAKLKLISIAIYFALAKNFERETSLKLLVLDDFLTSLDMGNRKLIIEYILQEFDSYQKIILTHNLQFFNLIKKLTTKENWNIQKLFTVKESSNYRSYIKNNTNNYIDEARIFLETDQYDLEIAGNKLRKAFEEIIQEFEQLLELGKVEKFSKIINSLKNDDIIFLNQPHLKLNQIIRTFDSILNSPKNDQEKVTLLSQKITNLKSNNTIEIARQDADNIRYNINKADIYKNILLNPSSHNDIEKELYLQECLNTVELLQELDTILSKLKGNN